MRRAKSPYRLHLFEVSIRGQSSKGEQQTLHGELVAVREELSGPTTGPGRFSMVPADCLLDLPPHPEPPASLGRLRRDLGRRRLRQSDLPDGASRPMPGGTPALRGHLPRLPDPFVRRPRPVPPRTG